MLAISFGLGQYDGYYFLHMYCQIDGEDCVNFFGFLRKHELYQSQTDNHGFELVLKICIVPISY